jgi:signal transduction histidine kinase
VCFAAEAATGALLEGHSRRAASSASILGWQGVMAIANSWGRGGPASAPARSGEGRSTGQPEPAAGTAVSPRTEPGSPASPLAIFSVISLALAVATGVAMLLLAGRLRAARRELGATARTSAAIAHEVKNSLGNLSITLDLLASQRVEPATAQTVHQQAREEISRLRGVTDDLTFFATPPRLTLSPVDLRELCQHATGAAEGLAADLGASLQLRLPDSGAAPVIAGDAGKLSGAVQNLIRNGLEAMAPGAYGDLQDTPRRPRQLQVTLSALPASLTAVIEVADNGAGLAAQARAHLFEPFVTTKRTGMGLGLAITRRVVEAHGGRIEAFDRIGGGTLFRLTFPTAHAEIAP